MAGRRYTWYVEVLDRETNKIISEALSLEIPEVKSVNKRINGDGRFRNLWICPFALITALKKSKKDLGLSFRVYNQVGEGQIRECTFLSKKKNKKRKETAR